MKFPSEIRMYPVARRIFSIERIIVWVEAPSHRSGFCPDPTAYWYSKAAPRRMSVAQWIEKRFSRCYPSLRATVVDQDLEPVSSGAQLMDVEVSALPRWCAYFCDINAELKFQSDMFAAEASRRLDQDGLENTVREESFLFWKSFVVRPHLETAVLTGAQCSALEAYLKRVATSLGGDCVVEYRQNQFLDGPFNGELAGVTEATLTGVLTPKASDVAGVAVCPRGHGELKPWDGKPRCWTCGWPEK